MKLPVVPPDADDVLIRLFERTLTTGSGPATVIDAIGAGRDPAPEGKYRHWDILRHLRPPPGLTSETWWLGMKLARRGLYRRLPLTDRDGRPFQYASVDPAISMLHRIDQQAGGAIQGSAQVTDPATRDRYLFKSLIEESITSSQLEGAATTHEVAKEMLQRGRPPADRSEQMIFNNFLAMKFIRRIREAPLTASAIFELHRILTDGTLKDPAAAGRFRREDERIQVVDEVGRVLHTPPAARELSRRMELLCTFANERESTPFLHPVVRAILTHLWLAYDHPFVDGNGRTARALFYWSMAHQGYWLTEFISISRIIKEAPGRYARAFLYTETDDNDATYFVLNQLRIVIRAIEALHEYLARKTAEMESTRRLLQGSRALREVLNHRQLALLNHALRHPGFMYQIESHRRSHSVSYQTARTDLLGLLDHRLLEPGKSGKRFLFYAPHDLESRLRKLRGTRRAAAKRR